LWIAANSPGWFSNIPFIENVPAYFLQGTFDVLDLVSIAVGAVAAYLTLVAIMGKPRDVC